MSFRRFAACSLAIVGMLVLTRSLPAAESPPKALRTPGVTKNSAAAHKERQRREDLERRVEQLEQHYEMKDPVVPAQPASPKPAP